MGARVPGTRSFGLEVVIGSARVDIDSDPRLIVGLS